MASLTKSEINERYRAIIESSYPLFVIHTNHVTILPDISLHTLCEQIYTTALTKLSLQPIGNLLSLRDILTATLDPSHAAFVLPSPSSAPLLAALPEDARGPLFAQAVAGLVSFLGAMATCPSPMTAERVAVKLERFAASEERRQMVEAVEGSAMWGDCFEKAQIGEVIMRAVGVLEEDVVEQPEVDEKAEAPALWHDGPHLTREFGVPDQFAIMPLN